ncbi:MAG: hypothetical protein ACRD2U_07270 [Terriglobales bacterium]
MATPISLVQTVAAPPDGSAEIAGIANALIMTGAPASPTGREEVCGDPDLWLYRNRTIGMLKRYLRLSIEAGRLPSLLGREFFRGRVTSYTVSTFESSVIFVHDVERILDRLDDFDRKLIGKIVFQDYSGDETAKIMNCGRRTVVRRFSEVVDRITQTFLNGGLLTRLPQTSAIVSESCQEGESAENEVSDCERGE